MNALTVRDCMMDLRLNMERLVSNVNEVQHHLSEHDLDGAALVLDSHGGRIDKVQESWKGLRTKLGEEGASTE